MSNFLCFYTVINKSCFKPKCITSNCFYKYFVSAQYFEIEPNFVGLLFANKVLANRHFLNAVKTHYQLKQQPLLAQVWKYAPTFQQAALILTFTNIFFARLLQQWQFVLKRLLKMPAYTCLVRRRFCLFCSRIIIVFSHVCDNGSP